MIDGATGTECEVRGVPQLEHAWNGGAALSHPDIVRGIHEDYIGLGAQIIITNTFGTSKHALTEAGVGDQFVEYNQRAVELAREARANKQADDVLVAGGISYWSWTGNHPPLDDLRDAVAEQALVMRDAGVDFIMLEMMIDIHKMKVTLESALACGLPVWVGLSCRPNDDGVMCLYNGETLADTIAALRHYDVPLLNIMHTSVGYIDECLDIVEANWSGMGGIYPDTGRHENHHLIQDSVMSPQEFGNFAASLEDRNLQLIGSCCGLGVHHLAALRDVMSRG